MIALPSPVLALITSRTRAMLPLSEAVAAAVGAGVQLVQLREPEASADELLALATELRRVTAGQALLIINASVHIALAVGADGVHLPENGPALARVRAALGGQPMLVGRSIHTVSAAHAAEAEGIDYVQVGAVYPTVSHPGRPPAGISLVRAVCADVHVPAIAVGAINAVRVKDVLSAGAAGVAVIDAVLGAENPALATSELLASMRETQSTRDVAMGAMTR